MPPPLQLLRPSSRLSPLVRLRLGLTLRVIRQLVVGRHLILILIVVMVRVADGSC